MTETNMNFSEETIEITGSEKTIVTDNDTDTSKIENVEQTSLPIIDENKPKSPKKKAVIIISICVIVLIIVCLSAIKIKQHRDDIKAADNVISLIDDIGEVTATSDIGEKIKNATDSYNNLSDKQKSYVSNIDTLTEAKKNYDTKTADLNMIILATSLKSNAELCQAFFSDYSGVWHNAIYRTKDEYNNGNYSDFNDALMAFQTSDTYTKAQETLKTINKMIMNKLSELKDATVSDVEAYEAIRDLYTAYQPMYDLAINPQGSYNSYTSEVQRLNTDYKTAYAALTAVMPSIETDE